jgi:branched-chain amino acid transport system permease protein
VGADRLVHAADPRAAASAGEGLTVDRTLVAIAAAGAALATVPLAGLPGFYESFLYLVLHWVILATSWNILSGYSGYFSFGHGAFYGAGTYATATLASRYDVPFLWTLPVAAAVAALLGIALGAVAFRVRRVRGELFALLTLAVTFVVATVIANTPIDGGPGVYLSAVPLPALAPTPTGSFYLIALAVAVLTVAIAYVVAKSSMGLALFAIHDDEDAAEVVGVPTYRLKLAALALSCALAGVAGGIQALFVSYVTVGGTFSITVPLTVVLMSALGGTRHWAGPAIGALAITALLYAFTAGDHAIAGKAAFGAILIAVILFMPDGVLGRRFARRAPRVAGGTSSAAEAAPASGGQAAASLREAAPGSAVRAKRDPPIARASRNERESMLRIRALSKAFTGVKALDGVDLDVSAGEIVGLLGPNGSGKSTLINVVSGHLRADGGSIVFEGRELADVPAHRIARAGIARTFQIPRPFAHLSVADNVALAATFGGASLDRAGALDEARRWLEFAGLAGKAGALPGELNLHQRKFLELARALASRPRLVLLDEVLSGLTPAEMDEAIALIASLRERGTTIVFVEHVMHAVVALTDRIVVLNQGRVLAQGPAADVMRDRAVVTAYLGAAHA